MATPSTPSARLLAELVAMDSVTDRSNVRIAKRVGDLLAKAGFRVSYQKERRRSVEFWNVIGRKGPAAGAPLLVCAHLDTVPADDRAAWTRTGRDPWNATVSGGYLYGLGAADDKGPLTAILRAVEETPAKWKRPLVVAGTFGEENGMGGALLLVKKWRGAKPFAAYPAEPTSLGVTYSHKGMGVIEITLVSTRKGSARRRVEFRGKEAHSSQPNTGVNALAKAVDELRRLPGSCVARFEGGHARNVIPARASMVHAAKEYGAAPVPVFCGDSIVAVFDAVAATIRRFPGRNSAFDPPVSTSSLCLARTEGGRLTFSFDFRLNPGVQLDPIRRRLENALKSALGKRRTRWTLTVDRDNPPLVGKKSSPAARLLHGALKEAGAAPTFFAKSGCTEAGLYSRWGVSSVVFGPGRSKNNIHKPNEKIPLAELETAVAAYRHLIARACGSGEA